MLSENHVNIENKILELTIYLYICYDEHEAPSICNITVYLSKSSLEQDVLHKKNGKTDIFIWNHVLAVG